MLFRSNPILEGNIVITNKTGQTVDLSTEQAGINVVVKSGTYTRRDNRIYLKDAEMDVVLATASSAATSKGILVAVSSPSNTSSPLEGSIRLPLFINWVVTHKCNLRCDHFWSRCVREGQTFAEVRELDTTEAKQMVDYLYEIGVRVIQITGGEPFMRPDMVEIIRYMHIKGMKVELVTNTTLLVDRDGNTRTDLIAQFIPYLDLLVLSLDLYHADAYKYRKINPTNHQGYIESVQAMLRYIAANRPDLRVRAFSIVGRVEDRELGKWLTDEELTAALLDFGNSLFSAAKGIERFEWELMRFRFVDNEMLDVQRQLHLSDASFDKIITTVKETFPQSFESGETKVHESLHRYSNAYITPDGKYFVSEGPRERAQDTGRPQDIAHYIYLGDFRERTLTNPEIWEYVRQRVEEDRGGSLTQNSKTGSSPARREFYERHRRKQDHGAFERARLPYMVHLLPGFACNLNCEHCFYANIREKIAAGREGENALSAQEVKDLINYLYDHGARYISIGGGEPFMRQDIVQILHYAHNKGMRIELVTNATLLMGHPSKKRKSFRRAIVKYVDSLVISLDPYHSSAYRRTSDAYCEGVMGLLRFIGAKRPSLEVKAISIVGRVHKEGIQFYTREEIASEFSRRGELLFNTVKECRLRNFRWDLVRFKFMHDMLPSQRSLRISDEDFNYITAEIKQRFPTMFERGKSEVHAPRRQYSNIYISPDGSIYVTDRITRQYIQIGSFREQVITRSDILRKVRRQYGASSSATTITRHLPRRQAGQTPVTSSKMKDEGRRLIDAKLIESGLTIPYSFRISSPGDRASSAVADGSISMSSSLTGSSLSGASPKGVFSVTFEKQNASSPGSSRDAAEYGSSPTSPLTLKQQVAYAAWGGERGVEVSLTDEAVKAKEFIVQNLLKWGTPISKLKGEPLAGLNIGSSGRFSRELEIILPFGIRLYDFDIIAPPADVLRQGMFIQGDADEGLPHIGRPLDFVIASFIFEHVNQQALAERIFAQLAEGGRAFIILHHIDSYYFPKKIPRQESINELI